MPQAQKMVCPQCRQNFPTSKEEAAKQVRDSKQPPCPVVLEGHVRQLVDDGPDNYGPYNFLSTKLASPLGNCYLCTEPLERGCMISTACHCKAVVHMSCLDNLTEYSLHTRLNDPNAENTAEVNRTAIQARTCGMCRGYILGAFENQYNTTYVAFDRVSSRFKQNQMVLGADGAKELRACIHSMLQVKRSILRDWRGSVRRNDIMSTIYAMLSHCFTIMAIDFNEQHQINEVYEEAIFSGMKSLRWHNYTSINMGVSNTDFLHHSLKQQHAAGAGARVFVDMYLPMLLDYLCKLIDNTASRPGLIGNNTSTQVPSPLDIAKAKLHQRAKGKLAEILTGELFDYVIENVNVKRQKTTVGTVHHQQYSTNEIADDFLSPHPGVFLSTNVDLLEQLLAHKESFAVFDDSEKLERIKKLRKAILFEVC
jgi:hypothetical protein